MINGGMIMYLNGLDELDQKIVQLLIKNARLSLFSGYINVVNEFNLFINSG